MKLSHRLLILFLSIALSLNIFLLVFEHYAFNSNYYIENFMALGVDETVGISENDLIGVTEALVSYIDDGSGNLMTTADVNGTHVVFFNVKERIHLDDIYILAKNARTFVFVLQVLMVLALLTLFYSAKGDIQFFLKPLKGALWTAAVFITFLGSLYFVDFNWAFHRFHEIFFSNDLWLLDPRTDRLIQLMPLDFFIGFTRTWLLTAVFVHVLLFMIYLLLKLLIKKFDTVQHQDVE